MNRLFLIIGLGIAIAALIFLSQGIKKAAPTDADLQQQAAQAQKEAQEHAPKTPPVAKTPEASLPSAGNSSAPGALPAEETLGSPATARHHLQIGWVYDEANQANPDTLVLPLQAVGDFVQKSGGTVSAEIVNLDVPTEDRSPAGQAVQDLGVWVDGKPLTSSNISSAPFSMQMLTAGVK